MLDKLFTSGIRVNILHLFIFNPDDKFYARQIEKIRNIPYTAVRRELDNLISFGFLVRENESNRKYYKINRSFFLYPEIKNMILKTFGVSDKLKECLNTSAVDIAFIYGSYASGKESAQSDLDIFVIGNIPLKKLHQMIKKQQEFLLRQININLYSVDEFAQKARRNDHFVSEVLKQPKIFLKGSENDITKLVKQGKNKTA